MVLPGVSLKCDEFRCQECQMFTNEPKYNNTVVEVWILFLCLGFKTNAFILSNVAESLECPWKVTGNQQSCVD